MASVTLKGNPCSLIGTMPQAGDSAPDFQLTKSDLSQVDLAALGSKTKIVVTLPSLDTPVCQTETRTFNEKAAALGNVEVLVVSSDLPFAQKRFCETEGIESVTACSDVRDRDFGARYGVTIGDGPLQGVMARAVFVIDAENKIRYVELVEEIASEPDYEKVLAAAG
jgi:thiol peroxidase